MACTCHPWEGVHAVDCPKSPRQVATLKDQQTAERIAALKPYQRGRIVAGSMRRVPEQFTWGGDKHNAGKAWLNGYDTAMTSQASRFAQVEAKLEKAIEDGDESAVFLSAAQDELYGMKSRAEAAEAKLDALVVRHENLQGAYYLRGENLKAAEADLLYQHQNRDQIWEQKKAAEAKLAQAEQALRRLHAAINSVIEYRQHVTGCEINQTDFCTCGLREAVTALDTAWKAALAAVPVTHEHSWQHEQQKQAADKARREKNTATDDQFRAAMNKGE